MPSAASDQDAILAEIRTAFAAGLRPDPQLTISEWADQHRVLTRCSAGEAGRWRTARTPYLREPMDALSPSSPYSRVVLMKPSQIGGSEMLLNTIGYVISTAPGPMLVVEPTVELARRFSRQRITSLIENTDVLRGRVADPRERDSHNTILAKEFAGGVMVCTGANSSVGLRSMPAKYLLLDEVDSYPPSASSGAAGTDEGDPCDLAIRRTETFAARKIALVSTPTIEGVSRIAQAYSESDQRKYYVPCPHCGVVQLLRWSGVRWPEGKPAAAWYQCERCPGRIEDHHKPAMLERGEWRVEAEGDGDTAGFWLNGLYSPWTIWGRLAKDFLRAKKSPERLQTFVNCVLAETFQQAGATKTDASELFARREPDSNELPAQVALVTAGVDVQADRLEIELVGWGRGEESWSLAYIVLPGSTAEASVWDQLDELLALRMRHPLVGREMEIAVTCVDSGYNSAVVVPWCAARLHRRIYAIKGSAGQRPIWPRVQSHSVDNRPLWIVGVDACKEALYARLKIVEPGAGYCHFPVTDSHDLGYFEQLTSETCRIRYQKGFAHREWIKQPGVRNECLDARCYAFAALHAAISSGLVNLDQQADQIAAGLYGNEQKEEE